MKEFFRFHFAPIDDEEENGYDVFALILLPDALEQKNDAVAQISDSISSYIESVPAWTFDGLVRDVLDASGLEYELIDPTTICIQRKRQGKAEEKVKIIARLADIGIGVATDVSKEEAIQLVFEALQNGFQGQANDEAYFKIGRAHV